MIDIITGLFGGLWGYVAAAGGAVLALVLAYLKGASGAKAKTRAEAAEDALKRQDEGRKAAGEAQGDLAGGKTPEEIVRGSDGKW